MHTKIEKIVVLENEIRENTQSFEMEKEALIAKYRNKAHEEIAHLYRDLEMKHECDLKETLKNAELKIETIDQEKQHEITSLEKDYEKNAEKVMNQIIEEVFADGGR